MHSFSFGRAPIGESDEPCANFQPELWGRIRDNQLELHLVGEETHGLSRELDGKTMPYKGQETYDELRADYLAKVGTVFGRVTLQRAPNLSLEQTEEGWLVHKFGGAEYPGFDGLIGRLEAAGFEARAVTGRSNRAAVAIQIARGEEFAAFASLKPIIIGD